MPATAHCTYPKTATAIVPSRITITFSRFVQDVIVPPYYIQLPAVQIAYTFIPSDLFSRPSPALLARVAAAQGDIHKLAASNLCDMAQ